MVADQDSLFSQKQRNKEFGRSCLTDFVDDGYIEGIKSRLG